MQLHDRFLYNEINPEVMFDLQAAEKRHTAMQLHDRLLYAAARMIAGHPMARAVVYVFTRSCCTFWYDASDELSHCLTPSASD